MSIKPIALWTHWGAPNPWKVVTILTALSVPYETNYVELNETKTESYLALTPNGRLPFIRDPNTGVELWETGAIIPYLVDQYDKDNKISYSTVPEKYLLAQWLAFQISGQGPYFGQATWFLRFHPEKLPSAIERYNKEIVRVVGVLELGLERNGTGWLVGDKCTYADLAFLTWNDIGEGVLKQVGQFDDIAKSYPRYAAWQNALNERSEVRNIKEQIAKARAEHGLP